MKTPDERKAYARQYRLANKDKVSEGQRKWYAANKDKKREYERQYRLAKRAEVNNRRRKWYAANRDKVAEVKSKWLAANRDEINKVRRERYAADDANRNKMKKAQRERHAARMAALDDVYVRQVLISRSGLRSSDIPAELVEAKRVQLKLRRLFKEKRNEQ